MHSEKVTSPRSSRLSPDKSCNRKSRSGRFPFSGDGVNQELPPRNLLSSPCYHSPSRIGALSPRVIFDADLFRKFVAIFDKLVQLLVDHLEYASASAEIMITPFRIV